MFKCLENCGECCSVFPISKKLYEKNKNKIQQQPEKITEIDFEKIVPITKDLKCVFLTKENKCAIYDERPEICKLYGISERLPCPYLKPDGKKRTPAKTKRILRKIKRDQENRI